MRTVWGLTGLGLATFALFACGVVGASEETVVKEPEPLAPVKYVDPLVPARVRPDEAYLESLTGVGVGRAFDRKYCSRAGPQRQRNLAELQKQKAAGIAKAD